MTYRAFVAFSGGGAKGLAHVGALKALELREVSYAGLSGTSAGAIVATLAAAGFRADEMFDPETGRTLLDLLGEIDPTLRRATGFFGPDGWLRIRVFRVFFRMFRSCKRCTMLGGLGLLALWLVPVAGAIWLGLSPGFWTMIVCAGVWTVLMAVALVITTMLFGGLARLTRFRTALATLLQQRLFPDEPDRVVTLADFGVEGRPPLKIVSANLSDRRLHLFSPDRTPDTPVADAVAASICLPIIFRPWEIDGAVHVDGGIVSNLPAWPFDEERELDPEALTIAIEIEEPAEEDKPTPSDWLCAAFQTALSGTAELNVRVAGPAVPLGLPTKLDLLDFDMNKARATQEVRDVTANIKLRLDKRLFGMPELYRDACKVAQALAVDWLSPEPGGRGPAPRVRVAIGRLERGYTQSLRMSHSVGFEEHNDEGMLVPLEGSVAGRAWREGASRLEILPLAETADMPGPAHRRRRKSRPADLKWVLCVPIFEDGAQTPRLLVQIDGNFPLKKDEATEAAINSVEEAVQAFFSRIFDKLKELEDDDGVQKRQLQAEEEQSPDRGGLPEAASRGAAQGGDGQGRFRGWRFGRTAPQNARADQGSGPSPERHKVGRLRRLARSRRA